ncbi:MAG: lysophospholipid acyltransferase family protein [Chloroflexota bacterium]
MSSLNYIFGRFIILIGRIIALFLVQVEIKGQENYDANKPYLLICNHFSWFDPPILSIFLPKVPHFVLATEALDAWYIRVVVKVFEFIPIWRGQVDRGAMRAIVEMLEQDEPVLIFPEGGVDPEMAERVAKGEQVHEVGGHMSRESAQLMTARDGTAYLANMSNAQILPMALTGTEQIVGNLGKFRRTKVTLTIGEPFGPLVLEKGVRGQARKQRLHEMSDTLMKEIAALLPEENRGIYA